MSKELLAELLRGYESEIDTFTDVLAGLNSLDYKDIGGFTFVRLNRKISVLKESINKLSDKLNYNEL